MALFGGSFLKGLHYELKRTATFKRIKIMSKKEIEDYLSLNEFVGGLDSKHIDALKKRLKELHLEREKLNKYRKKEVV